MGIFDKRRLTEEYTEEIRKQTDPYGFFCSNIDIERGESQNAGCPPFCICTGLRELLFDPKERNRCLSQTGDFIVFYDKNSVYEDLIIGNILCEEKEAEIIYFDEDRVFEGKRHAPFFKPEWSPDTLVNCNYIGDFFAVKKEFAVGILELMLGDTEGGDTRVLSYSEDELRYDFLLRASEQTDKVRHIAKVVRHIIDETAAEEEIYSEFTWRNQSQKYIKIRNDAFMRRGYDIHFEKVFERKNNSVINNNAINNIVIQSNDPVYSLSVIIPSKDNSNVLINCLESIKRCYIPLPGKRLEIIIVDNGSKSSEGLKIEDYLSRYSSDIEVKYIYKKMEFNYPVMCNIGVSNSVGEYILFLNDDIELIEDNTFERMYMYASLGHIGAVGAKLYYPGGNIIQHTGVVVDLDCGPTHKLATYADDKPYYYGINVFDHNVLAVTGACLMVSREKYFKCGGFNDRMGIGYNDIDLCVRLYENGYLNVILNECILFHHESLSRGRDNADDEKYRRLREERQLLYELHPWILEKGDPFYSVNLISDSLDYVVNIIPDYALRSSRSRLIEDDALKTKILSLTASENNDTRMESRGGRKNPGSKKVNFNIERTGTFRGIMNDQEDYYQLEGWAILNKRDNALYTTEIAFVSEDGTCLIFDTFKVSREDVAVVFVNEKNLFLTGFVCKIPVSLLKKEESYRVAVVKRSGITGLKYMALGDYYEPSRGYRTKEG
ncbi:MAG: glycosyltransferase [Lachnospiraceae bacterium]|nr:glycosyltransferase [Lachnospiraceae bacterium]